MHSCHIYNTKWSTYSTWNTSVPSQHYNGLQHHTADHTTTLTATQQTDNTRHTFSYPQHQWNHNIPPFNTTATPKTPQHTYSCLQQHSLYSKSPPSFNTTAHHHHSIPQHTTPPFNTTAKHPIHHHTPPAAFHTTAFNHHLDSTPPLTTHSTPHQHTFCWPLQHNTGSNFNL